MGWPPHLYLLAKSISSSSETMKDLGSVFDIGGRGLLGHHIVRYLLDSGDATRTTVFDVSTKNNRLVAGMGCRSAWQSVSHTV